MSETLRYYDDLTLGLKNMYAIESLEDGTVYGQEQADVARENEKLVVSKLKTSKANNKKLPPNVRLEDPSTFDPFSMVNVVTMRMFPDKANSDAVKSGRLTAYEALDADEKFKVMAAVPGSPVENTLAVMEVSDQAIRFSRNANASDKGISVTRNSLLNVVKIYYKKALSLILVSLKRLLKVLKVLCLKKL
jgi:hypothetical protein